MLKIHSNRLTWQRINFYRRNKYSITVEEFLDGNLDSERADTKSNYLEGAMIRMSGMPQVRVGVIGWAMQLPYKRNIWRMKVKTGLAKD